MLKDKLTSISDWTMSELQIDLIFGIGTFFLYIVVPTALLANEVRLAKQSDDTSGTAAILDAMVQAGFFIVAWLVFVTVIAYLLVSMGGHDITTNPAMGIYHFWNVDWINNDVIRSLDEPSRIFTENKLAGLQQARGIVFTMSMAKVIEIILLGVLLLLTVKLSTWLPLYKLRRTQHYQATSEIDVGAAMTFIMVVMMGVGMFTLIINIDNLLLTSVLQFALDRGTIAAGIDPKIEIMGDLWHLLKKGLVTIAFYNQ